MEGPKPKKGEPNPNRAKTESLYNGLGSVLTSRAHPSTNPASSSSSHLLPKNVKMSLGLHLGAVGGCGVTLVGLCATTNATHSHHNHHIKPLETLQPQHREVATATTRRRRSWIDLDEYRMSSTGTTSMPRKPER